MSTETEQQTELAIQAGDEETKEKNEPSADMEPPQCHCGELMTKQKRSAKTSYCNGCGFVFNEDQTDEYYYHCSKGNVVPHKTGYDLCLKCSKHMYSDAIKDAQNREKLYFIYNDNKIHGPITHDDILKMYITYKLKEDRMYIMSANGEEKWTKLEFPKRIFSDLEPKDEKKCDRFEECEKINSEIKQKYPELYDSLIKNIFFDKIPKIVVPTEIPKEEETTSLFKSFIKLLGTILAVCISIIISLHCLPTFIFSCCCCFVCAVFIEQTNKLHADDAEMVLVTSVFVIIYSGLVLSPILVIHFVLTEADQWNEMQSWMIAYIVWGIFSFIISCTYSVGLIFYFWSDKNEKSFTKTLETVNNIILLIMGVDFGDFEVFDSSAPTVIAILLIFPSLASLLPAAICGFIANYVLEEKFELKCSADIVNTDLCFDSEHGCCEVISSHDYESSYAFIGGLVSNIIATWAVIRVCGYLLVNAFPELSLYAKRKK